MSTRTPPPSSADATRLAAARADALLAARRWQEAEAAYRQVLAGQPRFPDAWFNLGYALRRQGRFDAALEAYARALEHGASAPESIHVNRAAILSDHLRDDDAACRELEAALRLAPGHGPALLNLGNLHEELGRRDEAIDCYERLLGRPGADADALAAEALARLVQLRAPASPADPLLARLDAASADGRLPAATRATMLFALGRARDALDDADGAFDAFSRANALAHQGFAPYDPAQAERRTRALAATAAPAPARGGAAPAQRPRPVFICGMFRSGSTLVERVLGGHPGVVAGGELDLLPRMVAGPLAPFPASLARLDDAACSALAGAYLSDAGRRLPVREGEAPRWFTDKRPDNYLLVGLVKRLFPDARIVHTVRDPLDNALSIYMQHLNPRAFPYAGRLQDIGHAFGEYRRLMAHWKALYPGDIHDVDYDAFVASPREVLAPLLGFLDLPWHEACLDFHRRAGSVRTASYWQVRRPLYREASGRWRRYAHLLGPLREALARQGVDLPSD
ncbi:tetratricopeptide repeat protein [Luteimonas sp. J16]|jgi:tetratricopeptide (TPR) repeat protein|uniref:sulfotransferase family protein n=1 Tax=unclassified Luteimonas TaxID=2629088 RepID=UPI000A0581F5|nr:MULTISPECIES: sulfotransferase [unclassified Luteimonas]TWG94419.1 tetratricopeptide repeat protein [Luteimonas sp. J16]